MRAARTFADLERDSFTLLVGWQAEKEERAAFVQQDDRGPAEALTALSAAVARVTGARS